MAMFDSVLSETMKRELSKAEYKLEDGTTVTNLEGICQNLISQALEGNLQVISLISELIGSKK